MHDHPAALIFSDLDGTLLDHAHYGWDPAHAALDRLREDGCGLILATSKTAAEVVELRAALGFADWPAIVENGGGILSPGDAVATGDATYQQLRDVLASLPAGFRGFGDMSAEEVSACSGLSPSDAAKAKARAYSEPGLWTGPDTALDDFLTAARAAGLFVQQGGRFLTLSFGGTKADRMDELTAAMRPVYTVALGDAPNDIQMLERADFGVIVANAASPEIPRLAGEESGRIRRTTREGPAGWADAIFDILNEHSQTGRQSTHG